MKRSEKRNPQAGETGGEAPARRRRMLRGTEQTPEEELRQAQDVLSWARRKHGPDSSFTIKAMIEVAEQLARQDRFAEEADLREQIVAALRSTLGPDTLSTASAEMRLAGCLVRSERLEDADRLLAHVVAVRTGELGEDDPDTVRALSWRAIVAERLGRPGTPGAGRRGVRSTMSLDRRRPRDHIRRQAWVGPVPTRCDGGHHELNRQPDHGSRFCRLRSDRGRRRRARRAAAGRVAAVAGPSRPPVAPGGRLVP